MRKLSSIVRDNRLYVFLLIFIIGINIIATIGERIEKAQREVTTTPEAVEVKKEAPPGKEPLLSEEEIKARQEKLLALAKEKPILYFFLGMLNLLILFIILVGMILDAYFLKRWAKKEKLDIEIVEKETPRWTIADIVRVALIFLSGGYLFVILQSFAMKSFPLLYNENFRMVFNTAVINVVGISVILYFVIKKHGQSAKALGLTLKGFSKSVFLGITGYVTIVPILLAIMIATFYITKFIRYQPPVQPIVEVFLKEKATSILWLSTMFAAIFGPIAEEIFFRGFMYKAIREKMGIFAAMMVTSAIFAFLHAHIVGFVPIMVLGLLLAYVYEKTGSLVSSMSVHIVHNVGMVLLVFIARGVGT